jgi:hypothetical protein
MNATTLRTTILPGTLSACTKAARVLLCQSTRWLSFNGTFVSHERSNQWYVATWSSSPHTLSHTQTHHHTIAPSHTITLTPHVGLSQFSDGAQSLLAELYRKLRQGDTVAGSRQSYRITVRQLESMIRLSEALARLHFRETIDESHIHGAYNLLRKSIIHVESDNISFENPQTAQPPPPSSVPASSPGPSSESGPASSQPQPDRPATQADASRAPKPLTISYEKYARVARMLVTELNRREERELPRTFFPVKGLPSSSHEHRFRPMQL